MSIPLKPKSLANPLPATLVQILGSDEVVLLELQGSLATQGEPAGELVGVLSLSNESVRRVAHFAKIKERPSNSWQL
jgi:hypothetical protein